MNINLRRVIFYDLKIHTYQLEHRKENVMIIDGLEAKSIPV